MQKCNCKSGKIVDAVIFPEKSSEDEKFDKLMTILNKILQTFSIGLIVFSGLLILCLALMAALGSRL